MRRVTQTRVRGRFSHSRPPPVPGALNNSQTRTLLALIDTHYVCGRATVRDVALLADRSVMTTHRYLAELRDLGLVEMSEQPRILRPLVRVVPIPTPKRRRRP